MTTPRSQRRRYSRTNFSSCHGIRLEAEPLSTRPWPSRIRWLGPVGQHQGHEQETKSEAHPAYPMRRARRKQLRGAEGDGAHAATERQGIEQLAGWFHRKPPAIGSRLRLYSEVRRDQDQEADNAANQQAGFNQFLGEGLHRCRVSSSRLTLGNPQCSYRSHKVP